MEPWGYAPSEVDERWDCSLIGGVHSHAVAQGTSLFVRLGVMEQLGKQGTSQ